MLRYAITDRKQNLETEPSPLAALVKQAHRLARDGVHFLQIREKDLEAKELIGLTRRIIMAVKETEDAGLSPLRVLVNGRPDVAMAAGADGVHLPSGGEQLTVAEVRRIFAGQNAVVSVACHTLQEVEAAHCARADLLLFSPVFGKSSDFWEDAAGVGLGRLAEACLIAGATPVLALGGVTYANAPSCVLAGAKGVAGIRLFQ